MLAPAPQTAVSSSSSKGLSPVFLWHEFAFLLLFATTALRLVFVSQFRSSILFASLSMVVVGLALWTKHKPSVFRWRVRLFAYVPLMMISYRALGFTARFINVRDAMFLQHLDQLIIGGNASLKIESMTSRFWSDVFSFLYLGFFIYIGWSLYLYGRARLFVLQCYISGLFTVYALGFLGYTIVSAAGPYLELADSFSRPIRGGMWTAAYDAVVLPGTNRTDCFPCLHVAVSAFILFFDRRHSRRRFAWMLFPCLGIWFATIYLRQHYFTDVIAGVLLTAFALRFCCSHSQTHESANIDKFNDGERISINTNTTPGG